MAKKPKERPLKETVSLVMPRKLLEETDSLVNEGEYINTSDALRNLIRNGQKYHKLHKRLARMREELSEDLKSPYKEKVLEIVDAYI